MGPAVEEIGPRTRRPHSAAAERDRPSAESPILQRSLLRRPQSAMAAAATHTQGCTDAGDDLPAEGGADAVQLDRVGQSVYLSRGLRHKKPPTVGISKKDRPRGDLTALREDIWDTVHDMYRSARTATADTAWKDEEVDFTGQMRNSHRPDTAQFSTARVDDAPSQLVAGDVMIADMQTEMKALMAKVMENRRLHDRKMSKLATNTWAVEAKVREKEKINAFLRQVVMTEQIRPTEVDAINDKAVRTSSGGPEPRTQLLHESMALMTEAVGEITGREFTRIVPPCPDPLMKPLSAAKPIRLWVLFVQNYDKIYYTYKHHDRQVARQEIMAVKRSDARNLLNLKDQDVDDTKCALDLMRTLVSSRHLGKLRQLGFHGDHIIIVKDDASIRPVDDRVTIEELLRHGDKTQPLMFARAPPGMNVGAFAYPENQMGRKAAKGPLIFRDTVMSARSGDSVKSAFVHTLRPRKRLEGSGPVARGTISTNHSTVNAHNYSITGTLGEDTRADGALEKPKTCHWTPSTMSADNAAFPTHSGSSPAPVMVDHKKSTLDDSAECAQERDPEMTHDGEQSFLQSWLPTFQELLARYNKTKNEGNTNLALRTEQIKRRSFLHREVAKILAGMPAEHLFHDAVDALEQKTRSDMLVEVATEFCVLGMLIRTLQSMFKMAESGLDLVGCCETFLNQVRTLLKAQHVRLWMVDPKNSQIWEWVANEKHPRKRSIFAAASETVDLSDVTKRKIVQKTGIAADVARTGVPINVPFPAVQSDSFSIEIDRLPGENALTVLCEPIRHRGEIIAVVQCYNKMSDTEAMARLDDDTSHPPFTSVDEYIIRMLCDNMAELITKCRKFHNMMSAPEYTLHGTGLTWNYPCSPSDLFELGQNYLYTVREALRAQHCILYVLSTNVITGEKKLWTACPDGRHGRRYVPMGHGFAGWVAEKHQSLNVKDASKDVRFNACVDAAFTDPASTTGEPLADFEAVNALAVPLTSHDGAMLGVCVMLNKERASFSRFDEQMVLLECQHVVLMVKTVHANFSRFATEETIPEALYRCMHLVECERTHLFLSETVEVKGKEHKQLRLYSSSDDYMSGITNRTEEMPPIEVPFSDGLLGYTARTGRAIILSDARSDPRFNTKIDEAMQYRTNSLMSIPFNDVKDQKRTLGVILIANKHGASAFSRMDNTMARIFSRMLAKLYDKTLDDDQVHQAAA